MGRGVSRVSRCPDPPITRLPPTLLIWTPPPPSGHPPSLTLDEASTPLRCTLS